MKDDAMSRSAIVLSIRPQYAEKIFDGSKRVELRRIRPKYISKGTLVLIYASSPIKSLVGAFKVEQVIERQLQDLWQVVQDKASITREEFDAYFDGISTGIGIFFSEVWRLSEPIELQALKEQMLEFHPPQGFRYATIEELASPQLAELMEDAEILVQDSFLNLERYER